MTILYICIILLAVSISATLLLVHLIDKRLTRYVSDTRLACKVMCQSYDNRLRVLETYSGTIMAAQCSKSFSDEDCDCEDD